MMTGSGWWQPLLKESSFGSLRLPFQGNPVSAPYNQISPLILLFTLILKLQKLPETLGILYLLTSSYLNESLNESYLAKADEPLSPDIQHIALKELKKATKNLRFGLRLGSSYGRGCRRWIDEHTLSSAKPGIVLSVAFKKWNPVSKQNRLELMVRLTKEILYLSLLNHPNLVKLVA